MTRSLTVDYEKNIASVIAMLHQRVKLWMPNYAPVDEIRRIKEAVGEALDANARRNDELITIRARVAELEAENAPLKAKVGGYDRDFAIRVSNATR